MTAEDRKRKACCNCRGACWEDLGVHGVRRLVRARGACGRSTFWVLLLISSVGLITFNALGYVFRYLAFPTMTSYQLLDFHEISGPAITVCNLNPMRLSVLDDKGWLTSLQQLYSGKDQMRRAGDMNSRDVYTKAGHATDRMLLRCSQGAVSCDQNNFTMTLTENGLCHTIPQIGRGQLDVLLNIERHEYSGLATEQAGVVVVMYDRREHPMFSPHHVTASPGQHTHVDIYASHVTRLSSPHGACESSSGSGASCLPNCVKDIVRAKCECLPFWAATGSDSQGEPICNMFSNVQCVEKQVSRILRGDVGPPPCSCRPGCEYSTYTGNTYVTALDDTDPARYLTDTQRYKLTADLVQAQNIRYRSVLTADSGSVHEMSALSRDIEELRYQIETLKRNINQVRQNIFSMDETLRKRTWFHFQVGLNGVERALRHGFLPHWDMVDRQFMQPLITHSQLVLFNYQNVISKLDRTSMSESGMRRSLYVTMEEALSARMELAIHGLGNFTKVYYSLLNMNPSSAYILTPQRRYDTALLPSASVSDVGDALREEYTIIADLLVNEMQQILVLRSMLEDVFVSGSLNNTAYQSSQSMFLQRNLQLQIHLELFRDKVINKVKDGLERQAEYFKKVNATFFSTSAKLSGQLLEATDHLDTISLHNYPHLVEFAQDAQLYLGNEAKLMSDLAQDGLSNAVRDSTDALLKNIRVFKAQDGATATLWQRFADHVLQLWSAMLTNGNLQPFYAKLNADVETVIQNPTTSTAQSLRLIFAHNKLLGRSEAEILEISPDDFSFLLNADVAKTTEHGKGVEIREKTGQYSRLTDVSLQLQDLDQAIGRSYQAVRAILQRFKDDTALGPTFVRESVVSLSLRVPSAGHEKIQTTQAYPMTQLLSDIGMLLPLYLGASVLTMFEVIDILCSCICCKHRPETEVLETQSPPQSPRHVTFHFPDTGNHVTSPARPALKRPRDQTCDYYTNDSRDRIPAYEDAPIEML